MQKLLYVFIALLFCLSAKAQDKSKITGNLQSNVNFFVTDSAIGAFGTPQYDNEKYGTENWLNLNYSNWGFDASVRFDMFGNSNLINPTQSYSAQGIGRWYIRKKIDKFDFAGGYIYDQIGTGLIFRAYEERSLAIDNALKGVRVGYQINDNWSVRAFTGQQKFRFDTYGSVMRGAVIEGFIKKDSSDFSFAPGFGMVARTFDETTVSDIVSTLSATPNIDREGVQYNTYAATIFNRLNYKNISWYAEAAMKTDDVMYNPFVARFTGGDGRLTNRDGLVAYSSITYAAHGLGISLENKYTRDMNFRTSPFEQGFRGMINFLPPMTKNNTYRLTTRYVPATQEFGEIAHQLDAKYRVNKKFQTALNFSNITDLDNKLLYRELQPSVTYKYKRTWQLISGIQFQRYNQEIYEGKGSYVNTIVPYSEFLYKFTRKKSLRLEAQYLHTKDDLGSWIWGLAEASFAPHWTIWISEMYKIKHKDGEKLSEEKTRLDGLHYPTVGVVYTQKANRISLAYVKQVEGINCAGGICRFEPTFHGVRLNVSSSF